MKYNLLVFPLLTLFFINGCVTPTSQMSLDDAKKVSIAMEKSSAFVPPPRRIDDLIEIINQPGQYDSQITEKLKARAKAKPPETTDPRTLKKFYRDRGEAYLHLYRNQQAKDDLQKALSYNIFDPEDGMIKNWLGMIEYHFGNYHKAIELLKDSSGYPSSHHAAFRNLVELYALIGDVDGAIAAKQKVIATCNNAYTPEHRFFCEFSTGYMEALILAAQGKYTEAEIQYGKIKDLREGSSGGGVKKFPALFFYTQSLHIQNLLMLQQMVKAEFEIRQLLKAGLSHHGKESPSISYYIIYLMRSLQAQGRLEEAKQLAGMDIHNLEAAGVPVDSLHIARTRNSIGDLQTVMEDYVSAMFQYDLVKTGMKDNQILYDRSLVLNPLMVLSLLKTGRLKEAENLSSQNYTHLKTRFGEQHEKTMEMLALRGMVQGRLDNLPEAVQDLSVAAEYFMNQPNRTKSYTRKKLQQIIFDDYLVLLSRIKGSSLEKKLGLNVAEISFKLAEANRGQSVQGALVASSARSSVTDPDLADLIRREQDADYQSRAMEEALSNLLAAPSNQIDPKAIPNLQDTVKNLTLARKAILEEIKSRFPKYTNLVNPIPQTIPAIQGVLHPGEVFLSFYATKDQTLVWAIPHKGKIGFASINLGRDKLIPLVSRLRDSLDSNPSRLGDIPEFDLALAHDLYQKLFSPVESVLKEAKDLFIVANSPLDQIPLAILPTAPSRLDSQEKVLFARYRQVPWLIRKASITMEPSASAFINLRTLAPGDPGRKVFLGFGDPLFNREQLALLKTETSPGQEPKIQKRGDRVQVRGIRGTEKGSLENKKISSIQTENLNRLPDTAEEITAIAQVLKADPNNDVFLREKASRQRVQTMPLSDRKVIAFATHALVSGDVDGLDQPALALSSPSVTGNQEDGLLTMTDIMKLKMNADWVVLSACNTGAGSGAGAEAFSGLGQAFFYAGSRAILASMYPVETTSAKKLVSGLFELQVSESGVTRSQSLRKSMLNLMDQQNLVDPDTGKAVATYAHPLFWAPFIISGDGGK